MKPHKSTSNREQPAEDNYFARVVGVYDIGVQPGYEYQGQMTDPTSKFEITYELVTTSMADGRPFWVSEEVPSYETSKKLIQRYLAAGIPQGSSLIAMLNKPVMISVKHSKKGYANVENVAGVPSGVQVPELRNPVESFNIYDEMPDLEKFNSFSDFKKNKFLNAVDFKDTELYKALALEDESGF